MVTVLRLGISTVAGALVRAASVLESVASAATTSQLARATSHQELGLGQTSRVFSKITSPVTPTGLAASSGIASRGTSRVVVDGVASQASIQLLRPVAVLAQAASLGMLAFGRSAALLAVLVTSSALTRAVAKVQLGSTSATSALLQLVTSPASYLRSAATAGSLVALKVATFSVVIGAHLTAGINKVAGPVRVAAAVVSVRRAFVVSPLRRAAAATGSSLARLASPAIRLGTAAATAIFARARLLALLAARPVQSLLQAVSSRPFRMPTLGGPRWGYVYKDSRDDKVEKG